MPDELDPGILHDKFLKRLLEKVDSDDLSAAEMGVIERFLRASHVSAGPENKKFKALSEKYNSIPFPSEQDIDNELLN